MIGPDRLHWILVKASMSRCLSRWDKEFLEDIEHRFDMLGEEIVLSDAQEEQLERIAGQAAM